VQFEIHLIFDNIHNLNYLISFPFGANVKQSKQIENDISLQRAPFAYRSSMTAVRIDRSIYTTLLIRMAADHDCAFLVQESI
jgi:hypothetical protein